MVEHNQLLCIGMVTKDRGDFESGYEISSELQCIINKMTSTPWKVSSISHKKYISIAEYITSNQPRFTLKYFGYLNAENRNRYWQKVMLMANKMVDNSLIYIDPDLGLTNCAGNLNLLNPEKYILLEEIFGLKLQTHCLSRIAYSQKLSEMGLSLTKYHEHLKKLFGNSVIFTGSQILDFGMVILASIDNADSVKSILVKYYVDHGLEEGNQIFILS